MSELTQYTLEDGVATITMDDGKVNALSRVMLAELSEALAQAESDKAVVVLTGRANVFSAGFDLKCPPEEFVQMVTDGGKLAQHMLAYPFPLVAACNGNSIAMGGFMLLSADHRIGSAGEFNIGLNEVVIGLVPPWFGIEIARHRLSRPYFDRCLNTGVLLPPAEAVHAGFLDEVVEHDRLLEAAQLTARSLTGLNMDAHRATKLRVRAKVLDGVRDGIDRMTGQSGREF